MGSLFRCSSALSFTRSVPNIALNSCCSLASFSTGKLNAESKQPESEKQQSKQEQPPPPQGNNSFREEKRSIPDADPITSLCILVATCSIILMLQDSLNLEPRGDAITWQQFKSDILPKENVAMLVVKNTRVYVFTRKSEFEDSHTSDNHENDRLEALAEETEEETNKSANVFGTLKKGSQGVIGSRGEQDLIEQLSQASSLRMQSELTHYFDVPSTVFIEKEMNAIQRKQGTPPDKRIEIQFLSDTPGFIFLFLYISLYLIQQQTELLRRWLQ